MSIDELILTREEVPINAENKNVYACFNLVIPIPEFISNHYKNINTYYAAKDAVLKSIDSSFKEAIIYECDKRLDFEKTLVKYSNHLYHKNSLDKYITDPLRIKTIDELKTKLLKYYNLLDSNIKPLEDKWPDVLYLCSRVYYVSPHKNDIKTFESMKKRFLLMAKKEKELDNKHYIISTMTSFDKGLACFHLPGNGVGIYPSEGSFMNSDFNMTQAKYEKLIGKKRMAYFPHNVDSFYESILLREIALNYLEELAKNI